jgi:hypothetical protein
MAFWMGYLGHLDTGFGLYNQAGNIWCVSLQWMAICLCASVFGVNLVGFFFGPAK